MGLLDPDRILQLSAGVELGAFLEHVRVVGRAGRRLVGHKRRDKRSILHGTVRRRTIRRPMRVASLQDACRLDVNGTDAAIR
jgi:hypothetical protein